MKLHLLLLIFVSLNFFAQIERKADNTFFIDSSFTNVCEGEFTWKYENGIIGEKVYYVQGKVNGLYQLFNEDGTINYEANYINGELEGLSTWYYENGKIHFKSFYKHGLLNGESIYYDEKGNIELREYYLNNQVHGKIESCYPNNSPKEIINYDHGKIEGKRIMYFNNGGARLGPRWCQPAGRTCPHHRKTPKE